jgi:OFA family oxalate/formate antiporter-like MFS transporter
METAPRSRIFYGYIIVAACFFIMIVFWGSYFCFGVFFDSLLNDFGWSRALTAGAYSGMGIMFGVMGIPVARLSDKYGPRVVVGACGLLMGGGYLLLSTLSAIWGLYLYLILFIGVGMGAYIALLPMIVRWFTKRRALMNGILFSGMGLGSIIFPPLANWLISTFQWRTSYIILGLIVIVVSLIAAQFLKRDPGKMGLRAYGDIDIDKKPFAMTGFTLSESSRTTPFWLISGMYFTYLFCIVTVSVHIVIHAIGQGMSPASAASIMAIIGIFQIIGMNVVGAITDRYGNKTASCLSFGLTLVAFVWLVTLPQSDLTFYIFGALMGFAGGGTQILFSPWIAGIFGLKSHGVILGTAAFFGSIGGALGSFLAGYIFDITLSYHPAFIICAALAALAVLYTAFIKPITSKKPVSQD